MLFRLSNKIIHVLFNNSYEEIVISTKSVTYYSRSTQGNVRKVALNSKIESLDPIIHSKLQIAKQLLAESSSSSGKSRTAKSGGTANNAFMPT